MSVRGYFERLRIRYVLRRWLGSRKGEGAPSLAFTYFFSSITIELHDPTFLRLKRIRREVDALCAEISAPRRNVR